MSYIKHLKFCKLSLYAEAKAVRLDFNCSRKPSLILSRLKYSRTDDLGFAGPRAILSKTSPRIQGTSSFKTSMATAIFSHFLVAVFCDVKVKPPRIGQSFVEPAHLTKLPALQFVSASFRA